MSKHENFLNDIKNLLMELIEGEEITFNQFTDILSKDNLFHSYNRKTLLKQRKRFFKGKEKQRSKKDSREIRMLLDNFINFLDYLARKGRFDLRRFKEAIIYCLETGIIVGK